MARTHFARALQRHGGAALIALMLTTNVLVPFAQAGLGVTTALAASGPTSATGTPNTLQGYLAQARALSATTNYTYRLNTPCGSGCTEDEWLPPNGWNACNGNVQSASNWNPACLETSWQNYYDEAYTGFQQVTSTRPDGATSVTQYYAGGGWGSNDWVAGNEDRGLPTVEDVYQGAASGTPLSEVRHTYTVNQCPTVSGGNQLYVNPYEMCFQLETQRDTYLGGGSDTSPAVPHLTQTWSYTLGATGQNHFYVQLNSTAVTGNDLVKDSLSNQGSSPTVTTTYSYTYRDGAVAPTNNDYFINLPAQVTLTDSASPSVTWTCTRMSYDGSAYAAGSNNTALIDGLLTRGDAYTDASCSNASADVTSGNAYDTYGQAIGSTDADALAGNSAHVGCTPSVSPLVAYDGTLSTYTSCTAYDTTYEAYPTSSTDALKQTASQVYEYSGAPSLSTFQDVYTQTTLPGETSTDGGSAAWTSRTVAYSFCASMSVNANPCTEVDTVRQLDGTNLAVSRSFYDRAGQLVETRTGGPSSGQDLVQVSSYNVANDTTFTAEACSVPALSASNGGRTVSSTPGYLAPALTGGLDGAWVNASVSGNNCYGVKGTTTWADALGRAVATDDAAGTGQAPGNTGCTDQVHSTHHTACTDYQPVVASSVTGLPSSDAAPYFETLSVDGNLHQQASYSDAAGRTAYTESFNGTSQTARGSGITSQAVSSFVYNPTGTLHTATDQQGNLNSFSYDDLGRLTSSSDPDQGTTTYSYDANGNPTAVVDARGASGTAYSAYDGLNRPQWLSAQSNGASPFSSYIYDGGLSCTGSYLIGRLCSGTFASGPSQSVTGSYTYQYDQRGRTTSTAFAIQYPGQAQTTYTLSATYDDANRPATVTYPAVGQAQPETLSYGYDNTAGGILTSLQSSLSSPTSWLLKSVGYNGQGLLTSAATGSDAPYQASVSLSYDGDLRTSNIVYSSTPNGGSASTAAQVQPTYDAASNIQTLTTTLAAVGSSAGGSETQAFCYDSQERLTWASTSGTGPCGAAGSESITGAGYTTTYSYDTLGRISAASVLDGNGQPLGGAAQGSYTYDATHVHGVASVGSGTTSYAASYDAAGNMICRAVAATSCGSGNEQLSYDPLGELIAWQNASGSSEQDAYDGSGQRVWQQASATSGGTTTTTTTTYVLGVQEVTTTSITGNQPTTSTISYYTLPGGLGASRDASGLVVQMSDVLGTPFAAENLQTGLVGEQLRTPYGQARYGASASSGGGMHTSYGFTGQQEDSQAPGSNGLDYFNARYYDPTVGQFTSADPSRPDLGSPWGTHAYGYVGGQVENATDPSGLMECTEGCDAGGGGGNWGPGGDIVMFYMRGINASENGGYAGMSGVNPAGVSSLAGNLLGMGAYDVSDQYMFVPDGNGSGSWVTMWDDQQFGLSTEQNQTEQSLETPLDTETKGQYHADQQAEADDPFNATAKQEYQSDQKSATETQQQDTGGSGGSGGSGQGGGGQGGSGGQGGGNTGGQGSSPPPISDDTIIVVGGTKDLPPPGIIFSGAQGSTLEEASAGVPHGQVSWTTAGDIRAAGGRVEYNPEWNPNVSRMNYQHVDVELGAGGNPFGDRTANPVARNDRFGGPNYPYGDREP